MAAKNGWGPLPDGYRLNSTGWVSADDREYVLSILSNSPDGFRYGRRTISEVAGICHAGHGRRPGLALPRMGANAVDRRRLILGGVGRGGSGGVRP